MILWTNPSILFKMLQELYTCTYWTNSVAQPRSWLTIFHEVHFTINKLSTLLLSPNGSLDVSICWKIGEVFCYDLLQSLTLLLLEIMFCSFRSSMFLNWIKRECVSVSCVFTSFRFVILFVKFLFQVHSLTHAVCEIIYSNGTL